MFYVSINLNILYTPSSFLAFNIPLIFSLQQLKVSEISTLFQLIKLRIFCILTIIIRNEIFSVFNFASTVQEVILAWTIQKQNLELFNIFTKKWWFSQNMKFNLKQELFNSLVLDKCQIKTIFCQEGIKLSHLFQNFSGFVKSSCLIRRGSGMRESKCKEIFILTNFKN